MISVPEQ